jgi:hypothetical protein
MKTKTIALLLAIAPWIAACGDDTQPAAADAAVDAPHDGAAGADGGGFPIAPALKTTIIDRMGRPAINTALTDPFWDTAGDGSMLADHQMKQDTYNGQAPADWAMNIDNFKDKLAVYDALDANCGNQIAFGFGGTVGYTTLATVLADDELYVFTGSSATPAPTCNTFLAVEVATLANTAPTDCGGRAPKYNTIDVIYSALAAGVTSGVSNGITSDADGAPPATFPYLLAPQ